MRFDNLLNAFGPLDSFTDRKIRQCDELMAKEGIGPERAATPCCDGSGWYITPTGILGSSRPVWERCKKCNQSGNKPRPRRGCAFPDCNVAYTDETTSREIQEHALWHLDLAGQRKPQGVDWRKP